MSLYVMGTRDGNACLHEFLEFGDTGLEGKRRDTRMFLAVFPSGCLSLFWALWQGVLDGTGPHV